MRPGPAGPRRCCEGEGSVGPGSARARQGPAEVLCGRGAMSGIGIAAGPGRGGVRATRAGDGHNLPRKTWACASNTFDELAAIQPDFEQNGGAGILRAVIWSSGTRNNQGWFFRSHHPALGSANALRWPLHRACHWHLGTVARGYRGHTRTNESPGPGLQVPRIFAVIGAGTDAWWPLLYQVSMKKRHFGAPRAGILRRGRILLRQVDQNLALGHSYVGSGRGLRLDHAFMLKMGPGARLPQRSDFRRPRDGESAGCGPTHLVHWVNPEP